MMTGFWGALEPKQSDRIYNPLPLYHATGGVCAVGMALGRGGALIIKKRFSVSEFWSDLHKYDATLFVYIGELCRYLLNAPPGPHEKDHHSAPSPAMACGRKSGGNSRPASPSRALWNFTAPPKAMSRC